MATVTARVAPAAARAVTVPASESRFKLSTLAACGSVMDSDCSVAGMETNELSNLKEKSMTSPLPLDQDLSFSIILCGHSHGPRLDSQ